jgi:hypothetical protein
MNIRKGTYAPLIRPSGTFSRREQAWRLEVVRRRRRRREPSPAARASHGLRPTYVNEDSAGLRGGPARTARKHEPQNPLNVENARTSLPTRSPSPSRERGRGEGLINGIRSRATSLIIVVSYQDRRNGGWNLRYFRHPPDLQSRGDGVRDCSEHQVQFRPHGSSERRAVRRRSSGGGNQRGPRSPARCASMPISVAGDALTLRQPQRSSSNSPSPRPSPGGRGRSGVVTCDGIFYVGQLARALTTPSPAVRGWREAPLIRPSGTHTHKEKAWRLDVVRRRRRRREPSPSGDCLKTFVTSTEITRTLAFVAKPSPSGRGQGEGSNVTASLAVIGAEARAPDRTVPQFWFSNGGRLKRQCQNA